MPVDGDLILTGGDIVEGCRSGGAVQERIQEPERAFPGSDQTIVQQRDDAGENRGGTRRAGHRARFATADNLDVFTLCRHIWEAAASLTGLRARQEGLSIDNTPC